MEHCLHAGFALSQEVAWRMTQDAGRLDDSRINISQEYEVRYWCEKLGVTADQLKAAVTQVGSLVRDVRAHLKKEKGAPSN